MSVLKRKVLDFRYELIIFMFLNIELFMRIPGPTAMYDWCITSYAMTYKEFGFGSRFLIGSFLNLFVPYLTVNSLYLFIFIILILLCLIVSIAMGRVINSSGWEQKEGLSILAAVYLASPASIAYLFFWGNYGRLDTYLILFTILALFFMGKSKFKFLVPVLSFMSMATQQVYTFTFLVIILGLVLYEIYDQKYSKESIIYGIITYIVSCGSFLYFQFLTPGLKYKTADEVIQALSKNTNIPLKYEMIEMEYFKTISDHWSIYVLREWQGRLLVAVITILLLLPLIGIFVCLWRQALKRCKDKVLKFIMYLMVLSPLASIPAFLITVDWGRWFGAMIIVQITFIFYLAYKKCTPMLEALQAFQVWCKNNLFLVILVIVYLSLLGKFETSSILASAVRIANIISMMF